MIVYTFLFPCFSISTTNLDERKFISGTKHFNNQWEYGGYTIYDKTRNHFELIPSDCYSEGFVWFSNRLPKNNWSVRTIFEFFLDSHLNHFGVWIISRFGQTGEVFGGPPSFTGVAILCKFSLGKLSIEVRQNNGSDTYRPIVFIPQFSTKLIRPKISLNITFLTNETLNILLKLHSYKKQKSDAHQNNCEQKTQNDKNETNNEFNGINVNDESDDTTTKEEEFILFNEKPIISLSHFWLGVTSYNPQDGKPLYLKSIRIKGLKSKFANKVNATYNSRLPKTLSSLLNANKTKNQKIINFLKDDKMSKDDLFDYEDVIECIETLINASNKMLRQKLLIHTIHNQMIPFTEAWQRRSLSATKDTQFLQEIVNNEMFLIEQEVSSLSFAVQKTFKKFQKELNAITNEFITSYETKANIKNSKNSKNDYNDLHSILLYLALLEIIIFLFVGPYIIINSSKSKLFEIEKHT